MTRRRVYWPALPVRWVHPQRGNSCQHVVAKAPDRDTLPLEPTTYTLCGRSFAGRKPPPATAKPPKVTILAVRHLPVCTECIEVLARLALKGATPHVRPAAKRRRKAVKKVAA